MKDDGKNKSEKEINYRNEIFELLKDNIEINNDAELRLLRSIIVDDIMDGEQIIETIKNL